MATSTKLLVPNLWIGCNNNEIINNKILAQEQKTRIMKELYKIAEKELRENDTARKQCLSQLQSWIQQNPDIENCILGKISILFKKLNKFFLLFCNIRDYWLFIQFLNFNICTEW